MRQSALFGKTIRENPAGEIALNAIFLERGGFVYKTMAGIYDYLPLGFRVLARITDIIREEMNAIGGQEIFLSALQPKERWMKTGRWEKLKNIMYQFKDNSGKDIGLATTHEEVLAEIATRSIHSYKDLPIAVYQVQTKFRDEPRAKSGLMRGREFLMKDLYSFHRDENDLRRFYAIADKAYRAIFTRCDLSFYVTEAGGGTFTKDITHEYQVLAEAGEDWIFYCASCGFAQNKEISKLQEGERCPACASGQIKKGKSIEVGNIFKLGTGFSETFGLVYSDEHGASLPVWMGSYGIGIGRLIATIIETHSDQKRGIIWPLSVSPFHVHLLEIKSKNKKVSALAEKTYQELTGKGIAVLYDDRPEKTAGEKFADADLIGIPNRIIVSERSLEKKALEVIDREKDKTSFIIPAKIHALYKSKTKSV